MPDEIDPPHATGLAAETVEAHAKENSELVFHAGWFCPFVQRVWIALEEKGLEYEYREVNPYKKEPHFLAINPKGLVPAIEHHGKALYESLTILEFLDDAYPSPSLRPSQNPLELGLSRLAAQFISSTVVPSFYKYLQAQGEEKQREAKELFTESLKELVEKWFVEGKEWARSDEFSLVDTALAPWIVRFYLLEEHRAFDVEAVGPRFVKYAKKVLARDSVKRTTSDREALAGTYKRYLDDTAESEVAKSTRSGEPMK
ncbi:hypothetical protein JCM8547_006564 [Rhodosporidiobolus lusitaniae]